jgi:transposase-like protein
MAWNETYVMEERIKFIALVIEGSYSMTELCDNFDISRKTGYKWINRYYQNGITGLYDRSRAPRNNPNAMSSQIKDDILSIKKQFPNWGAPKIFHEETRALTEYRSLVYYRGEVPTKKGQAAIPQRVIQEEAARGFEVSGVYRKRLRYFVDGLVVGSEEFIRHYLDIMRDHGHYPKRKNPISHLNGIHQSLREQRNTAVGF